MPDLCDLLRSMEEEVVPVAEHGEHEQGLHSPLGSLQREGRRHAVFRVAQKRAPFQEQEEGWEAAAPWASFSLRERSRPRPALPQP